MSYLADAAFGSTANGSTDVCLGGSGGSARAAVEDPDSLQSHQYAKVVDLISEGEIGGLVDGLRSVYLNDTPIISADGTANFTGVEVDYRNGTNTQSMLPGFSDVENETQVSVEVKHGAPIVRSITGDVDAARDLFPIDQSVHFRDIIVRIECV